jgi:hypothetical protein
MCDTNVFFFFLATSLPRGLDFSARIRKPCHAMPLPDPAGSAPNLKLPDDRLRFGGTQRNGNSNSVISPEP